MSYLNCPRCGLTIPRTEPAASAPPSTCPRCRGRAAIEVPMFVTERLPVPGAERSTGARDGGGHERPRQPVSVIR